MSNEAMKWAMDDAPMLLTDKGRPDTTARHVLQALAEHAHKDGTGAHPSLLRIRYRTGYDRRTVQRALRRLEHGGLIEADGAVSGCTRWTLALHLRRPADDWAALQAEEEAERAAAAERQRRSRAKRVTHSGDVTVTDADDVTQGAVTHSASARHALSAARTISNHQGNRQEASEPPPPPRRRAAPRRPTRAIGAPDDFPITEAMHTWARQQGIPPDRVPRETANFLDHHRAKGSTFKDWAAAWRTWMRRSLDYAPRPAATPPRIDPAERGIF